MIEAWDCKKAPGLAMRPKCGLKSCITCTPANDAATNDEIKDFPDGLTAEQYAIMIRHLCNSLNATVNAAVFHHDLSVEFLLNNSADSNKDAGKFWYQTITPIISKRI